MLTNYLEQLTKLAEANNVNLKQAFVSAGVPDSTYYRALNGCDLRFCTAEKIASYLGQQSGGASEGTFHSTQPD